MNDPWDGQWPAIPDGTIAGNIIRLMSHRKTTRAQLARDMGVVSSQVTKWLQQDDDQFSVRTMNRIAEMLNVPAFALMVPAFDAEYRRISIVARYLHFVYRYGPEWPKVHRWISQHLDALEEALGTKVEAEEFTPHDLVKKQNGAPAGKVSS
jgi:transcriptional regulator with XRE-family HTH domain